MADNVFDAVDAAIEDYEDALILVELRKTKIVATLLGIKSIADRSWKARDLYWKCADSIVTVTDLAKACEFSRRDFLEFVKEHPRYAVEMKCKCGVVRKEVITSRNRLQEMRIPARRVFVCEDCRNKQKEEWSRASHQSEARIKELREMPYAEYLKTDHWQELRRQKLKQAKYRCQLCNSPNNLEVHHRTYKNRGQEYLSDLTVLCDPCHERFHKTGAVS